MADHPSGPRPERLRGRPACARARPGPPRPPPRWPRVHERPRALERPRLSRSLAARPANRDDARHRLYTDGGARGNPGPAGIGAAFSPPRATSSRSSADFIGTATNNVAEYQALLAGLELALDRGVERLDVFLDSELVVRQVNGQYKVKDAGLKPLHAQACQLLSRFHEVDVKHVRREQNAEADRLVDEAIDAATTLALASVYHP